MNFLQWKVLCTSSLQSFGAWKFVDGSAVAPLQDPAEKQYLFNEQVETYHSRAAQARNIILLSCNSHIQQTLANVLTAQACWNKILQTYGTDGLVHIQDTWATFIRCRFQGEEIADFCLQYRAALDSCAVAGIAIQPTIQVLHFVTILDSHFEHWCANKREQMRRDPAHLPTLDALMNEVMDEALRKRDHASLQITVPSPKRQ